MAPVVTLGGITTASSRSAVNTWMYGTPATGQRTEPSVTAAHPGPALSTRPTSRTTNTSVFRGDGETRPGGAITNRVPPGTLTLVAATRADPAKHHNWADAKAATTPARIQDLLMDIPCLPLFPGTPDTACGDVRWHGRERPTMDG
ncbi:hypothetical protein [Streptomyces sp. NPDC006463]|uniref:hypothetical protein n=1 Tax=Streptomyces sp. NPDC006463 TaxID=3364746 RepID=UPI0036CFD61B